MGTTRQRLERIFRDLDKRIAEINFERRTEGLRLFSKTKVRLLGQTSLMANDRISAMFSLAQTADLDAVLKMDDLLKNEFTKLLIREGLVYDEDSYLIWIPHGAKFERLFDFENVGVETIDPESALVSKAVKAPEKNKQLIREAIASDEFPTLVDRILANGGKLENFA
ncbi:MAG: hypothetical protein AABZ06_09645 [Bdellovibrionota bacterium]